MMEISDETCKTIVEPAKKGGDYFSLMRRCSLALMIIIAFSVLLNAAPTSTYAQSVYAGRWTETGTCFVIGSNGVIEVYGLEIVVPVTGNYGANTITITNTEPVSVSSSGFSYSIDDSSWASSYSRYVSATFSGVDNASGYASASNQAGLYYMSGSRNWSAVKRSPPVVHTFQINSGAADTASRTVMLNNTATNSPTHYMASEDSGFTGAGWQTYTSAPGFTLSIGNGVKTVYFKVKSAGGESAAVNDTITLTEPPVVSAFQINNGVADTTRLTVTLNNTATNSPTHYKASEDSSFTGASWLAYSVAPTFTLSTEYGAKVVYFKVKNADGESVVVNDTITLKELPIVSTFQINNGADEASSRTVTLNNTATGSPTHYMASESASFTGASWQTYAVYPWFTLSAGDGAKTVYFKVKLADGESAVVNDAITLKELPLISTFEINNGATGTTSNTVTLNNTATGSPTYYMASESASFTDASWQTYAAAPSFTLSTGYGAKTVYFKVKNANGESSIVIDAIMLTELPVVSTFQINNGAAETTNRTVALNNTATGSPTHYMASESASFSSASWQAYAAAPPFTLSTGDGSKTVYFKAKNANGESAVVNAAIMFTESKNKWVSVSLGSGHVLAVKSDGTLWGWGKNWYGQLGDGTNYNQKPSPVQIVSDTKWVSVSAGGDHTLAVKSDGTLWAWGYNPWGQLGDGTNTEKDAPVPIGTDTKWVSVSAGYDHTLAVKSDGTLWAWGRNDYGQLGDGTYTDKNVPVQIVSDTKWVSVSAGGDCTLAVKSDGTLWA